VAGSFRFFRRSTIMPGVRLNMSRSGPSLSFGMRGAHLTVGRRGVRRTVGVPGTGLFYTSTTGHHTGIHTAHPVTAKRAPVTPRATAAPDLADQLRKLAGLRDDGILTEAEFAAQKAKLLG
jgi:Protein of unknown function (DUF4236)/Short C-terminal domain